MNPVLQTDQPQEQPPPPLKPIARLRKIADDTVLSAAMPKRFNWPLAKVVLFYLLVFPPLVAIYMTMIAEGMRFKVTFLAVPIYRLKWMPRSAERWDILHRWDLAIFASIGLLAAVWHYLDQLLKLWIVPDDFQIRKRQKPEAYKRFVVIIAVSLLLLDAYMFYSAMILMGWGGQFSMTALVCTIGYSVALIGVAVISINLHQDAHDFHHEEKPS